MTTWLNSLNLKHSIRFGSSESIIFGNNLPDWIEFLIWSGWWMRKNIMTGSRLFLVILVPSRELCSAACCIGSMLGSVSKRNIFVSWRDFCELSEGSKVYFYFPAKRKKKEKKSLDIPVEGIVLKLTKYGNETIREVSIESGKERFKNSKLFLTKNNIGKYNICISPHLSHIKEAKLNKINQFYKKISQDYHESWIHSRDSDCHLITNKAAWRNEVNSVFVYMGENEKFNLYDLLMPSLDARDSYSKFTLSSSRSNECFICNSPIAILDGAEAVKTRESVQSSNIIFILDNSEYNEEIMSMIALLTSARCELKYQTNLNIPNTLPDGIQAILFRIKMED